MTRSPPPERPDEALIRLSGGAVIHVPLSPTGTPSCPAWAVVLDTLPRSLQEEQTWTGRATRRPVWLARTGTTVEATLREDGSSLTLEATDRPAPLVPPRQEDLAGLATQLCALLAHHHGIACRIAASHPRGAGLLGEWCTPSLPPLGNGPESLDRFRNTRPRLVSKADGTRWLHWPWSGFESGCQGVIEVPLPPPGLPSPSVAEALRAAAESLAAQADRDLARARGARDQRLLEAVLQTSHDGLIAASANGDVVFFNDRLTELSSWSRPEVEASGWAPLVYPDPAYRARMLEWIRKHFLGQQFEAQQVKLTRRDGTEATCLLRTRVTRDEHGVPVAMGAFRDVSALGATTREGSQKKSLDGLGRLAGTVAHEFRNLLTEVMGHASILEHAGGSAAERARRITAAAERGDALTRHLLSFAHARPARPEAVELGLILDAEVERRQAASPGGALWTLELDTDVPPAEADPALFRDALQNVLANAEQTPGATRVTIRLDLAEVPPHPSSTAPTLRGECVRVRVSDDGPGFQPAARSHLFEPFWTDRPGRHGIGLAAVATLMSRMDGGVDVPEGVTGGVVDLLLPVSTGTPRHMASAVERSLPTGRETIWVVDDEPELVDLLTASLELLGYTVQGFDDGPAVISALALGHRPDLLTLDVRMPGMDGPAIHAAVRERGVLAPVLFCSALADVPLPDDERVGLMEKPFKLVELAVEVRRLIDRWVLVRQPGG